MNSMIIGVAVGITCVCMAACGARKNTVDSAKAVEQQEAGAGYSTGRVTTNFISEGCMLLIKLDGVANTWLLPVALEDRFKKNGLQLKFKYAPSKATTGACMKGQPVSLEEVTVVPAPQKAKTVMQDK